MGRYEARVNLPQAGHTESLVDLLDASHVMADLAQAATWLVADCNPTPQTNAAVALTEMTAAAMKDFVERFHEALVREGMIRE